MSMVLWDMFTGSAPYREILLRTLHPVFLARFLWNVAKSVAPLSSGQRSKGDVWRRRVRWARSTRMAR